MAVYECKYRLGLTDIGYSNRLSNKAIIKILENAGGMHSAQVGCGVNEIATTKLSWVLLYWRIQVISRPIYNSELTIKTWARDTNRVTTFRDFEIYDENNNLAVIATSKWTLINIETKSLAALPENFKTLYQAEEKCVFEDKVMPKLKEAEKYTSSTDYHILRSDIDLNDHVHNLYYLDLAYETLPEEIYRAPECNNIEIMYKKQIKLGNPITCFYAKENDKNIIAIKSKDESTLHSIIYLY